MYPGIIKYEYIKNTSYKKIRTTRTYNIFTSRIILKKLY